ncbi:caspase family protein [Tabrizicola caldifontis]|uniref:caspase family protein n=1 Tax=Tabrizicola caldifontis TaxID=2528036 RepID=UPI0010810789|nr:caspase family protein [Rhodobacter sp. YIM 73028]
MVENAILDDELQTWAQAALSHGVRVIGLIDARHSGTGFRAVGGAGVTRFVDEAQLGIPDDAVPARGRPLPPLSGEFVFLYSSQSDQRSYEYPLADGVTWHGEFTLQLARTLREVPEASWAQVLAATREGMVRRPARQMPEGEGPLLEAQVFGQGLGAARWRGAGDALAADLLDGLAEGAEVALYAGPAGGKPLAVMSVTGVSARAARLTGEAPEGALWTDLVAAPSPRGLRPTWCRS